MVTSAAAFDLLAAIRQRAMSKQAFTPSPAVAQAVMAQAQGGMPPGMDPSQMQGGGMPPGMDPNVAQGMLPGMDPAQMQGGMPPEQQAPPADPAGGPPPGPDPSIVAAVQLGVQQALAQQSGGIGGGGGSKPGSGKIDPQEFHRMRMDMHHTKQLMSAIVGALGITVPAHAIMDMSPPTPPGGVPTDPTQAQQVPQGQAAQGAQPSQIAQQLPALPPVAGAAPKQAADKPTKSDRLAAGIPIPSLPSAKAGNKVAGILSAIGKKSRK